MTKNKPLCVPVSAGLPLLLALVFGCVSLVASFCPPDVVRQGRSTYQGDHGWQLHYSSEDRSSSSSSNSTTYFNLQEQLKERQQALQNGIGRRYVVAGPAVKVHQSMLDGPDVTDNLVGFLQEGVIVTSQDQIGEYWILHDGGGGGPEENEGGDASSSPSGWSYIWRDGQMLFKPIEE